MAKDERGCETASEAPSADNPEVKTDEMSYEEYLKLTNPSLSDAEIASMIRKENRYTWVVRFEVLAFILFVIVILLVIFLT